MRFARGDDDPTRLLPSLLGGALAVANLARAYRVAQQLNFARMEAALYAVDDDEGNGMSEALHDMISGDFGEALGNLVGEAIGESVAGPLLLALAEVVLNVCLARSFGRRALPLF